MGVPRGKGKLARPLFIELKRAHHYILRNSSETVSYVNEHLTLVGKNHPRWQPHEIDAEHNETFVEWFWDRCNREGMDENLRAFARKPDCTVRSYYGYDINGFSFATIDKDNKSTTQSSGVFTEGEQSMQKSGKDKKSSVTVLPYYGVIEAIWELDYVAFKIVVFKCKWVDNEDGVDYTDPMGFTRVNLNKEGSQEDKFILASQARQVFYVEDPIDSEWSIVLQGKKYFFEEEIDSQLVPEKLEFPSAFPQLSDNTNTIGIRRVHDDGLWVDEKGELIVEDILKKKKKIE